MNIKQIGAVLVGAVLMALAGSAGAGTLYNGTVTPAQGNVGTYNVVIFEDSIFSFHINSVTSNANPANTPDVDQVRMYFYKGLNGTGQALGSTATLMGGTDALGTNWGVAHSGNIYEQYTGQASTAIKGAGGNLFQQQAGGYFNLGWGPESNFHGVAQSFTIQLQQIGTADQWSETFNITDFSTPETSSFALLLPGLVPLGIVLRRRIARR
jgi:hypothetical protein